MLHMDYHISKQNDLSPSHSKGKMLRFFLTHHFGSEQVSENSTTVGEVNTSEGLYLNSHAVVHIKANLDMTLLSLLLQVIYSETEWR